MIYTSDHLSVLEKNSFDAVVLLGVFTCIAEDKQQIELIENILKLLKKGGIIYISDFLLNNDERNVNRYNKLQNMYDGYSYGVFELNEGLLFRHHSYEWICKLLSPFKKLYYQEKKYKTLNNHVGNGFVYMGKRV